MAFDFPSSPTTGQQFTPAGGPTYTWNGYGWSLTGVAAFGPVLLNTQTVTAAASVDFTSLLTSAYDEYEVRFFNVVSSANTDLFAVRVGQSGVYVTPSYYYALNTVTDGGTNAPIGAASASATSIPLSYPNLVSNNSAWRVSGKMIVSAPLTTGVFKHIRFESANHNSTGAAFNVTVGGGSYTGNNGAIDSLRFMMSTGTITGTFKLYGIR